MEIKKLQIEDAQQFSDLIVNMYSNLTNLEWFTPMPFDKDNVIGMITNPRFYIVGAFDEDRLVGVSSLDYKCGKLIGKIKFPSDCNTDKLVEIGFNIVHSDHRGNKIMQKLLDVLLEKIKKDGFEWAFAKIHKDNISSNKSCLNKGFEIYCKYSKSVNKNDFEMLSNEKFFNKKGRENAKITLEKFKDYENIIVDYNILMKRI